MAEHKITSSETNEVPKNDADVVEIKAEAQEMVKPAESEVKKRSSKTETTAEHHKVKSHKVEIETQKMKAEPEMKQPEIKQPEVRETVVVKKGGTGLALLALLIALGLGGAGYYFGQQQVDKMQQKLTALESKVAQQVLAQPVDLPSFDKERQQIEQLVATSSASVEKLAQLKSELTIKDQAISALQTQINRLNTASKEEQPNDWLLSEADFLLNNALRKLVIDNDVDTSISLLKVADEVLTKVSDPRVISARTALNGDLKQLLEVNNVDQNAIMQRLSQLTTMLDEMDVLDVNFGESQNTSTQLSDSIEDWKENAEKSATSFLNHFIRITPRNANDKVLLAPNQDIYLRENIRLRLQIAIMAVPRQQDELYKHSLETVASWVRSYFDTNTEVAQNFLKSVDELAEQSIYVNVPNQLSSLNVLDKLLNREPQELQKVEISVDKSLSEVKPESKAENVVEKMEETVPPTQAEPQQ